MRTSPRRICFLAATFLALASPSAGQGPTWASPHHTPGPRSSHSMVFDAGRARCVVFGGDTAGTTWERAGDVWIQRTPAHSPPPRGNGAMAYDPDRGVTVLYGGFAWGGGLFQDTWEWNGDDWLQVVTPQSPPPLDRHAMAWHGGTNPGILLHGGFNNQTTWQYDGATWTLRATNGPGSYLVPMAYAASTQRTYVHTVQGGSSPATLWAWDGNVWTSVFSTTVFSNPQLALETAIAYDPNRNALIAVGGSATLGATILLTLVSPTQVVMSTMSTAFYSIFNAAFLPELVYDSSRRTMVAFGGLWATLPNPAVDTDLVRELPPSPTTFFWPELTPLSTNPSSRVYTDMAFDEPTGRMVMFGGSSGPNSTLRNDTWSFDGTAWTNHGNSPLIVPRIQPALCYSPSMGTVMFGGGTYNGIYYGDTWFWSNNAWTSNFVNGSPAARMSHDMVYDSARNNILMFGGYDGNSLSDTWALFPSSPGVQWFPLTQAGSPGARNSHAMAYDARRNRVVLFGGSDQNGVFLGDTWELTYAAPGGYQWAQRTPAQSPSRRWAHKMAFDPTRGVVVLTGGYGNPQCGNFCASHLNDVWEFDGDTWRERQPNTALPAGREGAGLAYDSHRRRIVMQSGSGNGIYPPETWYYNAPLDTAGSGMQGGNTRKMRCLQFPVAGQTTGFAFDSPFGFGWLALGFGPAPAPTLFIDPPLACGSRAFVYSTQPIVVAVAGNPTARVLFPLPGYMVGVPLCLQGLSLDLPGSCFLATDPLTVTVQGP